MFLDVVSPVAVSANAGKDGTHMVSARIMHKMRDSFKKIKSFFIKQSARKTELKGGLLKLYYFKISLAARGVNFSNPLRSITLTDVASVISRYKPDTSTSLPPASEPV